MSQTYTLFSLTKQRGDRWVVSLQFDWLLKALYFPQQTLKAVLSRLVLWMVSWQFPSTQVTMTVASVGLGIGLLVALLSQVLTQPMNTIAVPAVFSQAHTGPVVELITFLGTKYQVTTAKSVAEFYSLPRKQVAVLDSAGRPTESRAIQVLVGATHPSVVSLQKLELGDEVQLVGDNNGRYSYQLIASQVKSQNELAQLDPHEASLYILVARNLTNQDFLVLLFN